MNKIIKSLLMVSIMVPLQSFAQERKIDTSGYSYPLKFDHTPEVPYADSQHSIDDWLKMFELKIRDVLNKEMRERMEKDLDLIYNVKDKGSKLQTNILMTLYENTWDQIKKDYPNEKNAITAFCKYGKYLNVLNEKVTKCDKNFKLSNDVLKIKKNTTNSKNKNTLKPKNR